MSDSNKIESSNNNEIEERDMKHYISKWRGIYANKPDWSSYKYKSIAGDRTHNRKLLGMAKTACKELSSLMWSEYPSILVESGQDELDSVLNDNEFNTRMSDYLEYQAALGGFVIKGYANNGVKLDFITADKFEPIDWDGDKVTGGMFFDRIKRDDDIYTKIETHRFEYRETGIDAEGTPVLEKVYIISNKLIKNGKDIVPLSTLFDDLEPEYIIEGLTSPLFVYSKNSIANNICIDNPLGISIFANSVDTLEAIDTCYDALNSEIVLGKKRIIVPIEAIKTVTDVNSGNQVRYFDPTDEIFTALNMDDIQNMKIVDNSVELRVTEIIEALNCHLNILAMQLGFSAGTFSFDGKSVKTATEIVAENSKTFKTKKDYQTGLTDVLKSVVKIVSSIHQIIHSSEINYNNIDINNVNITWFDSLFESDVDKFNKYLQLVNSKLISKRRFYKEVLGYDDSEVDAILEELKQEQSVGGTQV